MSKYEGHTPGPWKVDIENGDNFIKAIGDPPSTWVAMSMTRKEREANAKLIADAPMLAERVEELEAIAKEGSALIVSIGKKKDKLAEQNEKMLAMLKRVDYALFSSVFDTMDDDYNHSIAGEYQINIKALIAEIEGK